VTGLHNSSVNDAELMDAVRAMRANGTPPKVIARTLGLPPARVAPLIKAVAQTSDQSQFVRCWVSPGWSDGLTVSGNHDWPDEPNLDPSKSGIAMAMVARSTSRGRATVSGFLVDTFCLGVKNAVGPRRMDDGRDLVAFREAYFAVFDGSEIEAPLDLVQHLVIGAVDYSRDLGFEPHPDYAKVAGHLGEWSGPSDIVFGRHGKPYYMQGPYDNPEKVIRTLRQRLGSEFDCDAELALKRRIYLTGRG
jgi:hypothetical protein